MEGFVLDDYRESRTGGSSTDRKSFVIPAKAGIQLSLFKLTKSLSHRLTTSLDSRFRGNDRTSLWRE